jgi:acetyl-CoA synthase
MPKALKEMVHDKLNATAKTLYDIDDFCSLIADETIAEEDPSAMMTFLSDNKHPVLEMDPLEF